MAFAAAEPARDTGVLIIFKTRMSDTPCDPRTDQELIAAANLGDSSGFVALYDRYRSWVLNLAWRFTGDRDTASDVLQEAFLYLLRKFPGFELTCQMKTFLYPVVRHSALALNRKIAGFQPLADTLQGNSDSACGSEVEPLANALGQLDVGHSEVVILRFVEDLSLQEIALAMELPLGTVKSRLHHALRQLREDPRLGKYFRSE